MARGTRSQCSRTTVPENAVAVKRAGRTGRRITVGNTVGFGAVADGRGAVAAGSGVDVAVGGVVAVAGEEVGLGAIVALAVGTPVAAGTPEISGVLVAKPAMLPFNPCRRLPSSRQPTRKPVRSTGTSHNNPRRPRRAARGYWVVRLGPAMVTARDVPSSRAGEVRITGIETVGAPAPATATGCLVLATAGAYPARGCAASSARSISSAVPYRSCGSFAIARPTTDANPAPT
ncbi:MAG: hypothetical protein H0V86_10405, partial [Chloroflexia bacterium]|nr:hypothetical protein [Chloroflexia bacterium]